MFVVFDEKFQLKFIFSSNIDKNQLINIMVPTIGYWNIRFLVEPIVLTLKQTNQPYQLKKYKVGDAPNYDKSDWLNEKDNLGLEYPNLPYYIDGEIKLTQVSH